MIIINPDLSLSNFQLSWYTVFLLCRHNPKRFQPFSNHLVVSPQRPTLNGRHDTFFVHSKDCIIIHKFLQKLNINSVG